MTTARQQMKEQLKEVHQAAHSDSNDGEIETLTDALEMALARWPGLYAFWRSLPDPEDED